MARNDTKATPKATTKAPTPQEAERALAEAEAAARELRQRIDGGDLDVKAADLVTADAEVEVATRRLAFAQRAAAEAEEKRRRDAYLRAAREARRALPAALGEARQAREELVAATQERFDALAEATTAYNEALRTHRTKVLAAEQGDEVRPLDDGLVAVGGERFRPIGPVSEASAVLARIVSAMASRAANTDQAVADLLAETVADLEAVAAGHAVRRMQQLHPPPDDRTAEQVLADEQAKAARTQAVQERAVRNAQRPVESVGGRR